MPTIASLLCATLLGALPALTQPPLEAPTHLLAPPPEAVKSPSGLATLRLKAGRTTLQPGPKDYVTLHYTGWTRDGKSFDSTYARQEPLILALERLMKGMGEGLQLMVEGETRRLWIPEALAFAGAQGRPQGDLVVDVELLSVDPPPTQAPVEVAHH